MEKKQTFVLAFSSGLCTTSISQIIAVMDKLPETQHTHPVIRDLPESYSRSIGKIMVDFAYIEWRLRGILYLLTVGHDHALGRIAVGMPRVEDAISRIKQLLRTKNKSVVTNLTDLGKSLKACEIDRDLVGHGIWMKHAETGKICVQSTAGSWENAPQGGISRKEIPELFEVDDAWFAVKTASVATAITSVDQLVFEIDAALASS